MAEKYPHGMILGALPAEIAAKVKTNVEPSPIASLTEANLELVRTQLENHLLNDDGRAGQVQCHHTLIVDV